MSSTFHERDAERGWLGVGGVRHIGHGPALTDCGDRHVTSHLRAPYHGESSRTYVVRSR